MIVQVNKKFLKDLAKIPQKEQLLIEHIVFEESEHYENIESAGIFEKLKGYDNYYKARIGNYRIGIHVWNETITFERVLHRKNIYKYFP